VSSASSSLTSVALRAALREHSGTQPKHVQGRVEAAVLVVLYIETGELHTVLIRRRADLRRHPGEISFPGGRREDGEQDLSVTALREAEEEIGLPRTAVELLGVLTPTPTVATGYAIHPFVGLVDCGLRWTPSMLEVDEVIELRLADLRAACERRRIVRNGIALRGDVYVLGDGRVVWGATARIAGELLRRLDPLLRRGER
jgi:8-oxo-dGTP pyrophosphatase MutT (NUDIX family)